MMKTHFKINVIYFFTYILCVSVHRSEGFIFQNKDCDKDDPHGFLTSYSEKRLQQKKFRKQTRYLAEAMLHGSSIMLIHGNLALYSLASSMIAAKLIYETYDSSFYWDSAGFRVFVSLYFSAFASATDWLISVIKPKGWSYLDKSQQLKVLDIILILGSRGSELVGGFLLAFSNLMSLRITKLRMQ